MKKRYRNQINSVWTELILRPCIRSIIGVVIGTSSLAVQAAGSPAEVVPAATMPTPYAERLDVRTYLDTLAQEHGFDRKALTELFAQVRQRQDVIERISRPAEKAWTWARYQKLLVSQTRIEQGVEFWTAHADTLARAHKQFGVAPEYVLAILGIETRYGRVTGDFPVIEALTTLGFDYPPRSKFFRKELTEFLLLAREEGMHANQLAGSYAGAMGFGQFIPSSYRHYAVDFDNDGVRDIWQNPTDAIGSIANYFSRHKWRGEGPVALTVDVGSTVAATAAVQQAINGGLELRHSVASLQSMGVQINGLAPDTKVALYKLEGKGGDEYWLGLHDFYVITRYNHSHMYALAVHQLSQAIKAQWEMKMAVGAK